jgi:hypothetical protein
VQFTIIRTESSQSVVSSPVLWYRFPTADVLLFWVLELCPCHSHGNSWLTVYSLARSAGSIAHPWFSGPVLQLPTSDFSCRFSSDCCPKLKLRLNSRSTVSRPVSLCVGLPSGAHNEIFLSDSCGFLDVGRPFWREDGYVIYCCCWASPAQSSRVWVPRDSRPYFIVPVFETALIWRARPSYLYTAGTCGPVILPGTGFPFRRLLLLAGLRWRYSEVTLRLTISQPVWLDVEPLLLMTRYLLLFDGYCRVFVGRSFKIMLEPTVSWLVSWCQVFIWGVWPDFYDSQTIAGLLKWGALSDERMGL